MKSPIKSETHHRVAQRNRYAVIRRRTGYNLHL
jgi:hypothetical protein